MNRLVCLGYSFIIHVIVYFSQFAKYYREVLYADNKIIVYLHTLFLFK